jgi:hypothetical protein
MTILPVPIPGPSRTGEIVDYTVAEINQILGFCPNVDDDPDKVQYSWGFLADGIQCGIWSYYNSHKLGRFSTSGPAEVFEKLFPEKVAK